MDKHPVSRQRTAGGVSRRTVVRGAAWAAPAIMIASAAPAIAASPGPVVPSGSGSACKHPGNPKWYHFTFCFENTSAASITVTLDHMTVNGLLPEDPQPIIPTSIVVPAGQKVCKYVDSGLWGNSANGQAILYFNYSSGGQQYSNSISTNANDLPPCGTGSDPGNNPGDNPPHTPDGPPAP